jgi:hypothetical protein
VKHCKIPMKPAKIGFGTVVPYCLDGRMTLPRSGISIYIEGGMRRKYSEAPTLRSSTNGSKYASTG